MVARYAENVTDQTTPIPVLAARVKAASRAVAVASTEEKDAALLAAADLLVAHAETVLEANAVDVATATAEGMATPLG